MFRTVSHRIITTVRRWSVSLGRYRDTTSPENSLPGPSRSQEGWSSYVDAPINIDLDQAPAKLRRLRSMSRMLNLTRYLPTTKEDEGVAYFRHPNSPWRKRWSSLILGCVMYNIFFVIYRISFIESYGAYLWPWLVADYATDALLWADIIINFSFWYVEEGLVITERSKIKSRYLKGNFFWDVASVLPLDFFYLIGGVNTLYRLNRCLRLRTILAEFSRQMVFHLKRPNIFRLVRLAVLIFVMNHWVGSIYFAISRIEGFGVNSWVLRSDVATSSLTQKYLISLWWSIMVVSGIGKDGMEPYNEIETIFSLIVAMLGVAVYAVLIGSIGSLINNLNMSEANFREKMDLVRQYIHYRALPQDMSDRIISYYDYVWYRQQGIDEKDVLASLPEYLRTEVSLINHGAVLNELELFKGCSMDFKRRIVEKLEVMIFTPGDYIVHIGALGQEMYIIKSGNVDVIAGDGKTVLTTLTAGNYFGELSVLFSQRRSASIVATTYADVFRLTKKDLMDVLKDFPHYRKEMLHIAKERLKKFKADQEGRPSDTPQRLRHVIKSEAPTTMELPNAIVAESDSDESSGDEDPFLYEVRRIAQDDRVDSLSHDDLFDVAGHCTYLQNRVMKRLQRVREENL